MRCAANKAGTVNGETHGIDSDHRRFSAAIWRRRRILGSQSRLLVIEAFPSLSLSRISSTETVLEARQVRRVFLCKRRFDKVGSGARGTEDVLGGRPQHMEHIAGEPVGQER